MRIFAFWEPRSNMPDYIKLCMETWKMFLPDYEIVVLDYSNIGEYIDIKQYNKRLFDGTFSMPQIADALRAMLLEEYGGIWMDVDTILLNDGIKDFLALDKEVSFFGLPERKLVRISWINAKPHARLMREWVKYNKEKIENFVRPEKDFWAYLGNLFVNPYVQRNLDEVTIFDQVKANTMPESSIGGNNLQTYEAYYFKSQFHLKDINSSMILLHNSWTPKRFREMSVDEFLSYDCTLSNILSEVLGRNVVKNKTYSTDILSDNSNKYILHCADGSLIYNPRIPGLNVTFQGTGGVVELYEPVKQFELYPLSRTFLKVQSPFLDSYFSCILIIGQIDFAVPK